MERVYISKSISLPEDLHSFIIDEAVREKRSFTKQVEVLLEKYRDQHERIASGRTQINPEAFAEAAERR